VTGPWTPLTSDSFFSYFRFFLPSTLDQDFSFTCLNAAEDGTISFHCNLASGLLVDPVELSGLEGGFCFEIVFTSLTDLANGMLWSSAWGGANALEGYAGDFGFFFPYTGTLRNGGKCRVFGSVSFY
jgi:hypothetical protein